MKKTLAILVFGGLVFNSAFAAVHSVENIPQKGEGDFLLASEINSILKTISGLLFDDASEILEVAGTVKATDFVKSDGTSIGGANFENIFESGLNVGIGTPTPSQNLDINNGNLEIRSSTPTIYFSDTDHRSGMIHVNSNLMYFLRGCSTGSESWCSTGNKWPLYLNLSNNNAYFGNEVHATKFVGDGSRLTGISTGSSKWSGSGNIYYSGGNVGIGTSRPVDKLDIKDTRGQFIFSPNAKADPAITVLNLDPSNKKNYLVMGVGSTGAAFSTDGSGGFYFRKGGEINGSNEKDINQGSDLMIISSDGVKVSGGDITNSPSHSHPGCSGWTCISTYVFTSLHYYGTSSSSNIYIGQSGNTVHVRGKLSEGSDARLKKNIETLPSALQKILSLRGVSYYRKDREDLSPQIGVIAQEVEKIYPELVHTDENGYKSVEYSNLVAPLIEAVKAQQAQIEDLKKKVASLKK